MEELSKKLYSLEGKIICFEGKTAVIEFSHNEKIHWPIELLPPECEIGSIVQIKMLTKKGEEEEREKLAKTLLNQILET